MNSRLFVYSALAIALVFPSSLHGQATAGQQGLGGGLFGGGAGYTTINSAGRSSVRFYSFGPIEEQRRQSLIEDSNILRHLINRGVSEDSRRNQPRTAFGVNVAQNFAHSGEGAVYVEGTGLILVLHTGVQVAPGNDGAAEDEADDEGEPTSKWEEARRELRGAQGVSGAGQRLVTVYEAAAGVAGRSVRYSASEFDRLNSAVRSALSEAANVRGLSDDESITVFVYGPAPENGTRSVAAWRVRNADSAADNIEMKQYLETSADPSFYYSYSFDTTAEDAGK